MILTCECGYRTPDTGPRWAKGGLTRHLCGPRTNQGALLIDVVCRECGQTRPLRRDTSYRNRLCRSCAVRIAAERQAELDEIAVARLLARSPVRSTRAERQAAVVYLTERGFSARFIGDRIGVSQRTVQRLRSRGAGMPDRWDIPAREKSL